MTDEHAKQIIVCLRSIAASLMCLNPNALTPTQSLEDLNKQLAACKDKPCDPKHTDNPG